MVVVSGERWWWPSVAIVMMWQDVGGDGGHPSL